MPESVAPGKLRARNHPPTQRIDERFDGVRALRSAKFSLFPGEVHALMGENGTGKSSWLRLATHATSQVECGTDGKGWHHSARRGGAETG
jgi:ABC-type sugar transport system ATPase subunit